MIINRIKLSGKYIAKTAGKATATIYAIAGLLSLLVSFEGIFSQETTFWCRLMVSGVVLAVVWLICAIVVTIIVIFTNKKKVVVGHNEHALYVVYGDLFDPNIVRCDKRYVCFAVNRCFDTVVNDTLVSPTTIHGIAFTKLYSNGAFTTETLNSRIQASLPPNTPFETLSRSVKSEGNLKRYETGTCANVQIDEHTHYLMLGMSHFDQTLRAQTPKPDYAFSMQKLIEAIDIHSQGHPVFMPIIGAGRSRTDLSESEAIRFMIESFRINQEKIKSDIYIVVRESAKNRVSIIDL